MTPPKVSSTVLAILWKTIFCFESIFTEAECVSNCMPLRNVCNVLSWTIATKYICVTSQENLSSEGGGRGCAQIRLKPTSSATEVS